MGMTLAEFTALVDKLERYAKRNPSSYKIRVGLLAILGHVYIVFVLALLIALIIVLIWLLVYSHQINAVTIKLLILLFIPVFIILRSLLQALMLYIPPPTGIELDRQKVPLLFEIVNQLTQALQCPPFNHILLVSDFNAAVSQIPRFGLLGGRRNYLLIGLPLLQALSTEQLKAVLAHEFGHLSGNHSKFQVWIYRTRHTWGLILDRLAQSQQGVIGAIFFSFFNWYIPFFNAYSFVLARADEYEADRCAAKLAGSCEMASALVNIHVKAQFVEGSFWHDIYEQVNDQPDPPEKPFHQLAKALKNDINSEQTEQWLQQALEAKTNCIDTHPCLSDRLTALNFAPEEALSMLSPVNKTAAEDLLGSELPVLTKDLTQEWQTTITFKWKERHTYIQKLRQQLEDLENQVQPLSFDEMWEQARITLELKGPLETIPLLQSLLSQDNTHALANFLLGQILLSQQDETGIQNLEVAMSREPSLALESCKFIYYYLQQQGREDEAEKYLQQAQKYL